MVALAKGNCFSSLDLAKGNCFFNFLNCLKLIHHRNSFENFIHIIKRHTADIWRSYYQKVVKPFYYGRPFNLEYQNLFWDTRDILFEFNQKLFLFLFFFCFLFFCFVLFFFAWSENTNWLCKIFDLLMY